MSKNSFIPVDLSTASALVLVETLIRYENIKAALQNDSLRRVRELYREIDDALAAVEAELDARSGKCPVQRYYRSQYQDCYSACSKG